MKKFFQFLSEAQESKAIQQAKRMGLDTDQHGGWYKNGEFVAKTVNGELKFYNKRQKIGEKDSKQSEKEKNLSYYSTDLSNSQVQQEPIPGSSPEQTTVPQETTPTNYLPVEKTKGTLTIAYGRFNPPHAGHLQLMDTAASSAESEGSDYVIVPSRTQDKNKDPLDVDTKVSIMRKMFPQHSERIVNDSNTSTIFDVLKKAHNDGYTNVRIIGGPNRVKEFEKLTNGYNGNLYQFDTIEVMPIGEKDADSDKAEDFSASRMRVAAAENDAIGKDNQLIWHLSADLKRFKTLTSGHCIIMGRKTFESFPKPLPNRTHIVISRQPNYKVPAGVIVVNNLDDALDAAKDDSQPFIIGGGDIYKQAMAFANKIELTRVHASFDADTFFPKIDASVWKEVNKEFHPNW